MRRFRFGEFCADEAHYSLTRNGTPVALQPMVLDTIFFLLRSQGRLISKHDLVRGPWQGTRVSSTAIRRVVMLARAAIDDPAGERIVTVHGRGYRFEGDVSVEDAGQLALKG